MLKICLVLLKAEQDYSYKCYAYENMEITLLRSTRYLPRPKTAKSDITTPTDSYDVITTLQMTANHLYFSKLSFLYWLIHM